MGDIIENYVLEEKLGQGTSGQVYKGKTKSRPSRQVAVKFIPKKSLSKAGRENLINEISALKKLKHQFIIQMLDFSWNDSHVYIVMEYANAGDLSAFIKKRKVLNENLARIFCQQLCSALLFMRKHNISHMDLKPGNLLLHRSAPHLNPILKVADFGFAQKLEGEDDLGVRGSPLYMAPEIVLTKTYSPKVDLWSVGVILFESVNGRAPFSSASLDELIVKIKEDKPVIIPRDKKLSDSCRNFLSRCLQRNPDERIDFQDLAEHPFLNLEVSIPHEQSVEQMLHEEELAVSKESLGEVAEASKHYEKAMEYAKTLYYYAEEESLRKKWKGSLTGYQSKLSDVKDGGADRKRRKITPPLPEYNQLYELCKGTPALRDGLEICRAARNYQLEGDLNQAVDRYTSGLGVLMPLLQKEPKGPRRDLLHEAVMHWLKQAEVAKGSLEAQENAIQGMESLTVNDKHCIIQ